MLSSRQTQKIKVAIEKVMPKVAKHYYLIGSLLGLFVADIALSFLFESRSFRLHPSVLEDFGLNPFFFGIVVLILLALRLDRRNLSFSLWKSGLLRPLRIFSIASIFGCLTAQFIWADLSDFPGLFLMCLYWTFLVGAPITVLIGVCFYGLYKVFLKSARGF